MLSAFNGCLVQCKSKSRERLTCLLGDKTWMGKRKEWKLFQEK